MALTARALALICAALVLSGPELYAAPDLQTREQRKIVSPSFAYAHTDDPSCQGSGEEDDSASCAELVVEIPPDAYDLEVEGFARELWDPSWHRKTCTDGGKCKVNWSAFQVSWQRVSGADHARIVWTFRNWSDRRVRQARMVVRFRVPTETVDLSSDTPE